MTQALHTSLAAGGLTQGGLRPGLGNDNIFATSALDLNFGMTKSLGDLVTFTRASSGTYVGSDGLLKTATTNLALRSEEFNDASWLKNASSVSANSTTAPNGTTTADKIIPSTANSGHSVYNNNFVTTATGLTYTATIYAKAAGYKYAGVSDSATGQAVYDLETGAVTSVDPGITANSAVNVGNNWWRLSISFVASTGGRGVGVDVWNNSTKTAYSGDGTSGVFLWGAQLEQASTAGEYIPTTSTINSAPRFDHNPTTGESLGLLVEEQRTNSVFPSSDLTNVNYLKIRCSLSAATVAPDGTSTAFGIIEDTSTNSHEIRSPGFAITLGQAVSYSFYVKPNGRNQIFFSVGAGSGGPNDIVITNLNSSSYSTSVGGGWYRISGTFVPTATTTVFVYFGPASGGSKSYTGDGVTIGSYFWGFQIEAGSFPTSYIPTTTATATRSADVASISQQNLGTFYSNQPGTFFVDARGKVAGSSGGLFSVVGTVFPGHFSAQYRGGSPAWFTGMNTPGGSLWSADSGTAFYTRDLVAISAGSNGASFYANGVLSNSTAADLSNKYVPLNLTIGLYQANYLNGHLSRLTYWPTRLADSTLQQITQ